MTEKHNDDKERYVHLEEGLPIFSPALEDPDPEKRADRIADKSYKNEQLSLQRKILLTQVGLVVFGLFGVGLGAWQTRNAEESTDVSNKSVLLAQKSERETRLLGEKQLMEGRKALETTIQNFQEQQRAWLAVKDPVAVPTGIRVTVANTGSTPAINVAVNCCYIVTQSAHLPAPTFRGMEARRMAQQRNIPDVDARINDELRKAGNFALLKKRQQARRDWIASNPTFKRHGVIGPGSNPGIPLSGGLNSDLPNDIASYSVGEITYNDIYTKAVHHTSICVVQTKFSGGLGMCGDGQKMD